jgi:hypothetical protein
MVLLPSPQHVTCVRQSERMRAQLEGKVAALTEQVDSARTAAMSLHDKDAWERQENRLLQVCVSVCRARVCVCHCTLCTHKTCFVCKCS